MRLLLFFSETSMNRKAYKTIVLSDIHLGAPHSKVEEVCHFLEGVKCKKLILNGDIIDGWYLQKGNKKHSWKKKHTAFFKQIIKMMERDDMKVIYVRGNQR